MANFLAVESLPLALVEALGERQDVLGLNHVDECVADIALVLEVDGQVEEVVQAAELLVDGLQQHLLRVLVGDVLDHQRCPHVLPYERNDSLSTENWELSLDIQAVTSSSWDAPRLVGHQSLSDRRDHLLGSSLCC